MRQQMMKIGAVAARADVNIQTVRYYERRGLLPKPRRTASNYRLYSEDNVRRVRFVKRAQELGFSLKEIKELLALRIDSRATRVQVRERAEAKITDIEEKIRSLRAIKKTLTRLATTCGGGGSVGDCQILEALEQA